MIGLRRMVLEDVARVVKIEESSFSNPLSKAILNKELNENKIARYFVLENEGRVEGYFGFWIIAGQAHILNIAVDEKSRGLGYGSILVDHLIKVAKEENIDQLTLEVRTSNKAARNLYKKFGFVDLGLRKDYYSNPKEDAKIMWLDLEVENELNNFSD